MASASDWDPRPENLRHRRSRRNGDAPDHIQPDRDQDPRAITTDAKVEKVFLSLYPADHPADATLHVEATNNPFDDSPVWEDITSKVGKFVHTFTNTTVVSSSYGLAYRF